MSNITQYLFQPVIDWNNKRIENRNKKWLEELEKTFQTPAHIEYERQTTLDTKILEFMQKLDCFGGSLNEYENMKNKSYKIIDLNNKGVETVLYYPGQDHLHIAKSDEKGNVVEKSIYDKQEDLIDKLVEENCVGMIRCQYSKPNFIRFNYEHITGYPVKEI